MVKALLDRVGNVLEKDFLFGSFLPALIFVAAATTTLAWVVGFEAALRWATQRTTVDGTVYSLAAGVSIVVFAYILNGMRSLLLRFWTGQVPFWPLAPVANVMKARQRRQFLIARKCLAETNRWGAMRDWFIARANEAWTTSKKAVTPADLARIRRSLSSLDASLGVDAVQTTLEGHFLDELKTFAGSSLSDVYAEVQQLLDDWSENEDIRINSERLHLDRHYGSLQTIRATRLGNRIESYNFYSYTRYGIEPETFWPHLQPHLGSKIAELLNDRQTTLYFAITSATLWLLYALLCALAGPWLFVDGRWFALALFGAIAAWWSYELAVGTADHFGDFFRAAFDLHRLDLLRALHRPMPASIAEEKKMWEEISRLAIYGFADFPLTATEDKSS